MDLDPLLSSYAAYVLRSDPIWATSCGLHAWDGTLGRTDGDHWRDHLATLRRYESELAAQPEPDRRSDAWLNLQVSLIDVRSRLAEADALRPWERAPYVHPERVGRAVEGVLRRLESDPAERVAELLFGRLNDVPNYLAAAGRNLARPPEPYLDQARKATAGLADRLATVVAELPESTPPTLLRMCEAAAARAADAVSGYAAFLDEVSPGGVNDWAAGADYVDTRLREHYLLDMDHRSLHEWGLERVDANRRALREYAAGMDRDLDWQDQITRIRADHPNADDVFPSYGREMAACRAHTVAERLASVPEPEECVLGLVPAFQRASIPMGLMDLAPVYSDERRSAFRFTPIRTDEDGSPDEDHLREHCHAFIASITGHETYPGHHLQRVHHLRATATDTSVRRAFTSPLFVEGWGLYVEDLLVETGQLATPEVVLFTLRNALWRSTRVVVDTGLHTRGMSVDEAVRYLMDEASLGRHMAAGEVARYVRHDNPTYPSAYALGRSLFHELRAKWRDRAGPAAPLERFHDAVLGFGSVPHRLIEERVLDSA